MIDRVLLFGGWLSVVALSLVFVLPTTRLVYHPTHVEIVGDQVTLYRHWPWDEWGFKRPRISYVETIRPLTTGHNGGHPCVDQGGPFRYSAADDVGTWDIPWAADCIDDPLGYIWSADWHWHIGQVKVGPTHLSKRVLRTPCSYKISSTGIIHGPDSPHWGQTSTDRCFATRTEAEKALE